MTEWTHKQEEEEEGGFLLFELTALTFTLRIWQSGRKERGAKVRIKTHVPQAYELSCCAYTFATVLRETFSIPIRTLKAIEKVTSY